MLCSKCGMHLPEDASFCTRCGNGMKGVDESASSHAAAQGSAVQGGASAQPFAGGAYAGQPVQPPAQQSSTFRLAQDNPAQLVQRPVQQPVQVPQQRPVQPAQPWGAQPVQQVPAQPVQQVPAQPIQQPVQSVRQPVQPMQQQPANPVYPSQGTPYRGQQMPPNGGTAFYGQYGASKNAAFTPVGIASRVLAGITIVLMFLPWLSLPIVSSLSGYASTFGYTGPMPASEYTMLGFGQAISFLGQFGDVSDLAAVHMVFLVGWVIALVGLVAGLVYSFLGKKSLIVVAIAAIVAAFVALAWSLGITVVNGVIVDELSSTYGVATNFVAVAPAAILTLLTAIGAAVTGFIGNKQ